MTTKYIQDHAVMHVVASGAKTAGTVEEFGLGSIGIWLADTADTKTGAVAMMGVFELAKATGVSWSQGARLFWEATANNLTNVPTANIPAGIAWNTRASGDTLAQVAINIGS